MIAIYGHVREVNRREEKALFKLKDITGKGTDGYRPVINSFRVEIKRHLTIRALRFRSWILIGVEERKHNSYFWEGSWTLHEMVACGNSHDKALTQGCRVSHPAQSCSSLLDILSVLKVQWDLLQLRREIWCNQKWNLGLRPSFPDIKEVWKN